MSNAGGVDPEFLPVKDMLRKGRDLERLVLAQAVRWVLEDRVLVHGNKTVVFND